MLHYFSLHLIDLFPSMFIYIIYIYIYLLKNSKFTLPLKQIETVICSSIRYSKV